MLRRPPFLFLLALAVIAFTPPRFPPTPPHPAGPRRDDPEAREAFELLQRAFPGGRIPAGAQVRARRSLFSGPRPRDKSHLWASIGPAPLDTDHGGWATPKMSPAAGRASALAVDPSDPRTIYAGYALGGVWKTSDGGQSWSPLMDGEPSLAVGAVAIDPAAPSTLYVGTGEPSPYLGYGGRGILRSTNGGASFEERGAAIFEDLAVSRIVIDGPAVYAAALFGARGRGQNCNSDYDAPGQGVYRSTDGGDTWTLLKEGKIVDLEIDTSVTPRRLLVSDYAAGAFVSEDGGSTWIAPDGLPTAQSTPRARRIELAFSPANPTVVYAGMGLDKAAAMFISLDGGKSFSPIPDAPDYCQAQCYYDNAVAVDPTDEATVYLGGASKAVWKTTNGTAASPEWVNVSLQGAFWIEGDVHPDVHAIVFDPVDPKVVYAASDGGISRSADAGGGWAELNDGVGTLQMYALCAGGDALYGGAQDNGVFMRAVESWQSIVIGDGGPCAVDPSDPRTALASIQYATVLRTNTGFTTTPEFVFSADASLCDKDAPGCGDRVSFIAPLAGDPSTPGTYYVGTYRLWKTSDSGSTWQALSEDLTSGEKSVACPDAADFPLLDDGLTAVTVAPGAPSVLYTGSQAGWIFATTDGGATWSRVDKAPLPKRWVSAIAVDPRDARVVFAAFSGFDEGTPGAPGHVFRSADGGATWSPRDIGEDIPVDALLAHPVASGLLYAGTDVGVLVTTDGGLTWSPLGDGMPSVPVYALAFRRADAALVAGTFGRSAFALSLPPGPLTVTPSALDFHATAGEVAPQQELRVGNGDPLGSIAGYTVAADASWVAVHRASGDAAGAAPDVIPVAATAKHLEAGTYDSTLRVTPADGTPAVSVPVHLVVTPAGCGCRLGPAPGGAVSSIAVAALMFVLSRGRTAGWGRRPWRRGPWDRGRWGDGGSASAEARASRGRACRPGRPR